MKKNRSLALAMASLTLTGMLGGCDPARNNVECVYGPPPVSENDGIDKNTDTEPEKEIELPEPLYAPPNMGEYKPEENIPMEIYGPPAMDEEPTEGSAVSDE